MSPSIASNKFTSIARRVFTCAGQGVPLRKIMTLQVKHDPPTIMRGRPVIKNC